MQRYNRATCSTTAKETEEERAERGGRTVRLDYRRDALLIEKDFRKWAWQISVKKAFKLYWKKALEPMCKELFQMHTKGIWQPVSVETLTASERRSIIRSSMFFKEK